jgi:hypothetical protein
MAIAPANSADRQSAHQAASAASDALRARFNEQEREIERKISDLTDTIGTGRAPTQAELAQFAAWEGELDQLNNRRRAIIFLDFAQLADRAKVNAMLAQVRAVRAQLQEDKAKVAAIVDRVKRIEALTRQADTVIRTLARLAPLLL